MGLFGHGGLLSKGASTAMSALPGAITGFATGGPAGAAMGALSGIATAYNEQQATNAANQQSWDMMNAQNAFNAQEAQKTRDWQTKMANTAHQREMADLEKAGLNPVLAANDGGAVPAGATASGSMGSIQKADAMGAMQTAMQLKRQEAEIANIEADTYSKEKTAGKTDTEIKLNEMNLKLEPVKQQVENELLRAQTKTQKAEAAKAYKEISKLQEEIKNISENTRNQKFGNDFNELIGVPDNGPQGYRYMMTMLKATGIHDELNPNNKGAVTEVREFTDWLNQNGFTVIPKKHLKTMWNTFKTISKK